MNRAHLRWVEKARARQVIHLQELFNDYWTSKSHELAVRGQWWSPTSSLVADRETQRELRLESIVALWNYNSLQNLTFVLLSTAHGVHLMMFRRRNLYARHSLNSKNFWTITPP